MRKNCMMMGSLILVGMLLVAACRPAVTDDNTLTSPITENKATARSSASEISPSQAPLLPTLPPANTSTPAPSPTPSAIHVSADGRGDYPSLQDAVADPVAGSTIVLAAGTYRLTAPLDIDRSIQLLGAGPGETVIVSNAADYVVRFSGEGTFAAEGITFRHEGIITADVVVVAGGVVSFSRLKFSGATQGAEEEYRAGVRLQGNAIATVQDCAATGNGGAGFWVEGQAQATLERNECSDNLLGISISGQAQPTLESNVCRRNVLAGIAYWDSAGGTARENECAENGQGIGVHDEARPTLERNVLNNNSAAGAVLVHETQASLYDNKCSGNAFGIVVGGYAEPILEGNACHDNGETGIVFSGNTSGVARANVCSGNGRYGILVDEAAHPELVENVCRANRDVGIAFLGSTGGAARHNECAENQVGILVLGKAAPELTDNECYNNTSSDMEVALAISAANVDRVQEVGRLMEESDIVSAAWSPNGRLLALGSATGSILVFDAHTLKLMRELEFVPLEVPEFPYEAIVGMAFSPSGSLLAAGTASGVVRLWDAETWNEVLMLGRDYGALLGAVPYTVAFSPNGSLLAAAYTNGTIVFWDGVSGQDLGSLGIPTSSTYRSPLGIAFSPDGTLLASGAWDSAIHLWNLSTGQDAQALQTDDSLGGLVTALAFSPNGSLLAAQGHDRVIFWNVNSGERIRVLEEHTGAIFHIAFSADGSLLASAGYEGMRLSEVSTGKLVRVLEESIVQYLSFSPDGSLLVSISRVSDPPVTRNTVRLWGIGK